MLSIPPATTMSALPFSISLAENVDGDSGNFYRNACVDGSLSCGVLSETCLDNVAHIDLIDLLGLNACSLKSFLDRQSAQIGSRNGAELSAHCSDRCSAGTCQDYFSLAHGFLPPEM